MRNVDHNMTARNDWYDSEPGYIYRLSSYDPKIKSKKVDTINLAMMKVEVVCEFSGANGVHTLMGVH